MWLTELDCTVVQYVADVRMLEAARLKADFPMSGISDAEFGRIAQLCKLKKPCELATALFVDAPAGTNGGA